MSEKPTTESYTLKDRSRDITLVMVRALALQPTLQPADVKALYVEINDLTDSDLKAAAVGAQDFVKNLPELKRIALLMRVGGEPFGNAPFHQ